MPDSVAIAGGPTPGLDLWETRNGAGLWHRLPDFTLASDTLRTRVLGSECNLLGVMSLVLERDRAYLRVGTNWIPTVGRDGRELPARFPLYLITSTAVLEPALLVSANCDTCMHRLVGAYAYRDSVGRATATIQFQPPARRVRGNSEALARAAAAVEEEVRAERIRAMKWSAVVTRSVIARRIRFGMTRQQVLLSWGEPDDINRTAIPGQLSEQWAYGERYIYFTNGVVTAWQD